MGGAGGGFQRPRGAALFGVIAREKGDFDQALDYLNRSLLCDRSNPVTWKHLGNAHFFSANHREAAFHYEQAVSLQPNYAEAYNKLGITLDALSDARGAAEAFEAGWRLQPDCPEIAYNYGVYLAQGRPAQCGSGPGARMPCVSSQTTPRLPTSWLPSSRSKGSLSRPLASFKKRSKCGRIRRWRSYQLSEFAAEGRYEFPDDQLRRLQDNADSGKHAALERSHFNFAVATVLNKQGRYDEAFRYYRQANELRKSLLHGKGGGADVRGLTAVVDRIIATHGRSYFESVQGWGLESDVPVFIVGMPRSGSTLVEQILATHPRVFGAGEVLEVGKFITRLAQGSEHAELTDRRATREVASAYLRQVTDVGEGAARVTIKTLSNFLYLAEIATLFPNAQHHSLPP